MIAAARTFYWECFWRRRWGFTAVALYLVLLRFIPVDPGNGERFGFTVMTPATACILYLIVVFSFGFSGDLARRESLYPSRLFTLPLSTPGLVWPPMLYGMVCVASVWLAMARFALQPAGLYAPLLWPALFLAVFLGWAQALTWLPYGLRSVRVVLIALWLIGIDTVGLLAIHFKPPAALMLWLLVPQLPLVYLVAWYAVGKARQGHVPDWSWQRTAQHAARLRELRFSSAESAQTWLEWRQHGRALLSLVAMLVPFELLLLFLAGNARSFVYFVLALVALTPVFMAACTAGTMRDSLSTFIATRPMTSADLVAMKLRVAVMSTLISWVFVLAATLVGLTLSHTWFALADARAFLVKYAGAPRALAFTLVMLLMLMLATWRQLVQSLYIGLTGRVWLMKSALFITLVVLVVIVPVSDLMLSNQRMMRALWQSMRWILATLVLLKMCAAAWTATRLYRNRLISDELLLSGAITWVVVVLLLHVFLIWLLHTPHVPAYFMMLIAILSVPLARVAAAPLALAWNRHR